MGKLFKIIIIIGAVFLIASFFNKENNAPLRVRVIANSNSAIDQSFKFEVTETLLSIIDAHPTKRFEDPTTISFFTSELKQETKSENMVISYERVNFPSKSYQGKFIPSGSYWTLVVRIGKAEGKNWWSILYPEFFGLSLNERMGFEDNEYRSYVYDKLINP